VFPCRKVGLEFLDSAPARFDSVVQVRATPAEIFETFEDAHSWTLWAPPIRRVEWTSPKPFGVGTTRTVYMAGGLVGREEFIAWEPGRRMAFRFDAVSRKQVDAFVEDYHVEDLDGRVCRVSWTMALAPTGPGRIVMPLVAPLMGVALRWMLGRFARHVESRARPARQAA
jgi:hypothetical protein